MRKAADAGVGIDDGAREILVVKDVATRMIAAIPTESRHTDQVVDAMKRLMGRRKVKMGYSDVALEFDAAMVELRISIGSFTSWLAEEQFSCGKDESRDHQSGRHSFTACWSTCTVLAVCLELCCSQSQH